jgi:aldose 1-epimerase
MMLIQARARLDDGRELDLLDTPDLGAVAAKLDGGPEDFAGNASFSLGGAILLPYANRVLGRSLPATREIEARLGGEFVRLPRNWGGKARGAAQYAMHGLILATPVEVAQQRPAEVVGRLEAGDFGGRWPSRASIEFTWRLAGGGLELQVSARNVGQDVLPMGIGWHPWFRVPSARREQVRIQIPAGSRLQVNNYDEVIPTGVILPVAGTPYDFRAGGVLGDLYLDECMVDLVRRPDGELILGFDDPAADYRLRLTSRSGEIRTAQVHAPLDRQVVVLEPQFNWIDPGGAEWGARDAGMAAVAPGETATFSVRLEVERLTPAS